MAINKISCIIPAYNEGPRIGEVLRVVCGHPLLDEIIVIDDGSTDNTKSVLEKYPGITIISNSPNKGKTYSVVEGIKLSQNDIIMLIDADLSGLTTEDISNLAEPVLSGRADVSITIRKNSLDIYKISGIDFVSGERVFDKKILGDIQRLSELPSFGLEVFMNDIIIKNQLRIKIVLWNNVSHYRKSEKVGWLQGTSKEIRMLFEIIATIGIPRLLSQVTRMRPLRVK